MPSEKQLNIVNVPIGELKPSTYNPRKWDEYKVEQLKESIQRFGVVDPLIVNGSENRKNIVIGGHFRLHIAKILAHKTVPVVYLNIPDIKKEKELNLRLNKNTGDWDIELLKEFDLDLLFDVGFDDSDLSDMWDDVLEIDDDNFDLEEEIQKIKEPKTKLGDIYQLGKHRLICEDSTNPETLKKLLGDTTVDMAYSDPPFNIGLSYNKSIGTNNKYGGKTNDSKSEQDYSDFVADFLKNTLNHIKENAHIFTWCDESYIWLVQELYKKLGIDQKRVCLWIKNNQNVTPQIAFNKAYEPCVYGTVGTPYLSDKVRNLNEVLNKEIGTGNRLLDDIEDYLGIWLAKRLPANEYEHPTQKPVTLHEKPLRRCTKPGDKVLDLFGGSGSTMIACEQLNRVAYLVELDPIFCDVIISRYERMTHDKAKLIN